MLNIILTSYNRPILVERALNSLFQQSNPNWECWIQDDDSNQETLEVLEFFALNEPRIHLVEHETLDRSGTRYSILINEVLPNLKEGIVGYLCDNVQYGPELVESVLQFFKMHPYKFAGYVQHRRDVYKDDGSERVGSAGDFGHWDILPPVAGPIWTPDGWLDHSQVFHRLPSSVRWNESPEVKARGDGDFFSRLVLANGPIYPIGEQVLTYEHLLESKV
jgi:glycosyltransferase involved in cell wall biosynthesis